MSYDLKRNIAKILSIGIMLMGIIHIVATFTPLITDKLALLPDATEKVFTYFSLMCGALLILGGGMIYLLTGKVAEHLFVRKPYMLTLFILIMDGVLAVVFMPHNPFAWTILVLTALLLFINVIRVHDNNR